MNQVQSETKDGYEPQFAESSSKSEKIRTVKTVAAVAAGGLAVAGVFAGIRAVNEANDSRHANETAIANEDKVDAARFETAKAGESRLEVSGKVFVLLRGATIRSNAVTANEKLFGYIPGNEVEEVKSDTVYVISKPVVNRDGAVWLDFVDYESDLAERDYTNASIQGLVKSAKTVNYTALVEQKKLLECKLHGVAPEFGTVSDKNAFVDNTGAAIAYGSQQSVDSYRLWQEAGAINCDVPE